MNDEEFVNHCIRVDNIIDTLTQIQYGHLPIDKHLIDGYFPTIFLITAPSDYSYINVYTNNIESLRDYLRSILPTDFSLFHFIHRDQPFQKDFIRRNKVV